MSGDHDHPRGVLRFQVAAGKAMVDNVFDEIHIVLSGCMAKCTRCHAIKNMEEFGLRVMPSGIIRNQAQCTPCRNESSPTPVQ